MKTLTIIPSRLSATRLPGKPLLKINNLSIISHVLRKEKDRASVIKYLNQNSDSPVPLP